MHGPGLSLRRPLEETYLGVEEQSEREGVVPRLVAAKGRAREVEALAGQL